MYCNMVHKPDKRYELLSEEESGVDEKRPAREGAPNYLKLIELTKQILQQINKNHQELKK